MKKMKVIFTTLTLLMYVVVVSQNTSNNLNDETNFKSYYTDELKDLYKQSHLIENTTPEAIEANRLAIKEAWEAIDPERASLYKPVDKGGNNNDFVVSEIIHEQTPISNTGQGNRWAEDIVVHNLRVEGGVGLVSFNNGAELYASSFTNDPSPILNIFTSTDVGETWTNFRSVSFADTIVKTKMITLSATNGDNYLLVYYLTDTNLFRVLRWNLTTGGTLDNQGITGNVTDFTIDRNYPINTATQRVFAVYRKTSNDIFSARSTAGSYGFDWVDEGMVNFLRSMPSLAYSRAGNLYLASVSDLNDNLYARLNTDYLDPNAWEASEIVEDGTVRESLNPTIRAERQLVNSDNVIIVTSSRGAGSTGKYNVRRYIRKDGGMFSNGITNASPNGISYLFFDSFIDYENSAQVQVAYLRQSLDGSQNNRVSYRLYDGDVLNSSAFASSDNLDIYDGFKPLAISSVPLGSGEDPMIVFTNTSNNGLFGDGLYFDKESTILSNSEFEDIQIQLYPNPATETVIVNLPLDLQSTRLLVSDPTGKEILYKELPQGSSTMELDVSNYKSGIYFFTFNNDLGSTTKKLIKR
jgi:hypothetical protein